MPKTWQKKSWMKSKYYRKLLNTILLLFIIVLITKCDWLEPCGECFTPPEGINLMILDEQSGINLISPEFHHPDSIRLYYNANNIENDLQFDIYNKDSLGFIYCLEIGFMSSGINKTFYLELNSEDTDTIYMDTEVISEDCCTWHELANLEINGKRPDFNPEHYAWMIYK